MLNIYCFFLILIRTDIELREIGISRENWEALPSILKQRELSCLEQHKLMFSMGKMFNIKPFEWLCFITFALSNCFIGFVTTPYKSTLSEALINKPNAKGKKKQRKEKIMTDAHLRRTSNRLNNDKASIYT